MNEQYLSDDCKKAVKPINIGGNRFIMSIPIMGHLSHLLNVVAYETTVLWEDGHEPDINSIKLRDSNMVELQSFNIFEVGQLSSDPSSKAYSGYCVTYVQDMVDLLLDTLNPVLYLTVEP